MEQRQGWEAEQRRLQKELDKHSKQATKVRPASVDLFCLAVNLLAPGGSWCKICTNICRCLCTLWHADMQSAHGCGVSRQFSRNFLCLCQVMCNSLLSCWADCEAAIRQFESLLAV